MGFLEAGAPLSWEATARYRDVVKRRGVREYIQLHKQFSADVFPTSTLSWGDEVEYCLLNLDADNKVARLYLGAEAVLRELKIREDVVAGECLPYRSSDCSASAVAEPGKEPPAAAVSDEPSQGSIRPQTSWPAAGKRAFMASYSETPSGAAEELRGSDATSAGVPARRARLPWQTSSWHPEYGTHMIEAIPGTVYPLRVDSILDLLPSMQVRRKKVQAVLPPGCYVASLGSFPSMGAPEYRRRPQCCCLCSSPSCCRVRAAGGEDTSAQGRTAGADGDAAELAAREKGRLVQTGEASYAGLSGATPSCSAIGDSVVADGCTVADSTAAAGPGFLTERTGDKKQETIALHVRTATPLLPHISPEGKASSPRGKFASSNGVVSQKDLLADAQGKSAVVTNQDAAYRGRKIKIGPEKQTLVGGREGLEDGEQAANDGHSLQAANLLSTEGTEGKTAAAAAAVVAQKLRPACLSFVGVTAHTGNFAYPPAIPDPSRSLSKSLFVGDALINPHPRFGTLTANIRKRRGRKAEILIPLFVDERTALPPVHRNIDGNTETLISATTHTAHERFPRDLFAAGKTGVANVRVPVDAEVAKMIDVGGAVGLKAVDAGTKAKATAAGADVTTAGVDGWDSGKEGLRVAEGAYKDRSPTCADETRSVEEIYRQLMLEGKILHDGKCIYMDAMGFGMGMHCVQGTFGCPSMRDARYLYDQLAVLAPLWLSLSAATPFMRGLLAAVDSRWDVIAACVDCRTDAERYYLPKSRYGSVSLYIGDEAPLTQHLSFYNDVPAPVNDRAFSALVENGVDEILAKHLAFLFVRDPLVIFKDKLFAQTFTKIRKNSRAETGAPSCPFPSTDRGSPGATTACPARCATATHTSLGTAVLSTVSAVTAESPGTVHGEPTTSVIPHPSRTLKAAAYPSASNPDLPLQQQQVAQEQEAQILHLQYEDGKEEEEECDALVMAEAATPWDIDDGTTYKTTEDFENLQSTNWNSVRFKPPAAFKPPTAFKPIAAPETSQDLAETCKTEETASLSESASGRSSKNRHSGRGSNRRRRGSGGSVGGRRRKFISKDSEAADLISAVDSGKAAGGRKGTDSVKETVAKYESNGGNSVGIISIRNPRGIGDSVAPGECGERNRQLTVSAAGKSGEAVRLRAASAPGTVARRRRSACARKMTSQVEREKMFLQAASLHKTQLPTPKSISTPSCSFASSVASFPCFSTCPSAAVAADDCCAAPWRVEFRTPDVQLTDFENAACLSLVSVLVQVILEERLDFYLPMSLNDENMRRAVECNSILRQKFWFRNDVRRGTADRSFAEFTLHQILFGISSPRVSDATPMQTQTDSSSSTHLSSTSSPYRSPFLSSACCSVCPRSTGSPFVYSPFLSCLSYTYAPTPSRSSSSYCTHTVSPLASQQQSAVPSPVAEPAACFPFLPSSPHAPPAVSPHHSPRLPHTPGAGDGGVSKSASLLSASHWASPWSAASAPAALRVCAPVSGGSARSFPSVADSCPVGTSSSVASLVSSRTSPPSLQSSVSPFIGLVPLSLRYIEKQLIAGRCSREAAAQYLEYFDYLRHRTEGVLPTDASFLRACLAVHPAYNQDSIISASSCFDLCRLAVKVGLGEMQVPELFGPFAGRTGMRVSAASCCFDNGIPVVTSSFLSHFVSDAFKEELRGCFREACGGCWQQEREQLCACRGRGENDGRHGGAARSEGQQRQQETTVSATAATNEKKAAQTERDAIAAPGRHAGKTQVVDQAAGPTYDKEEGVQGEAALNKISRDGDAATESNEGLDKGIATIQKGQIWADRRLAKEGLCCDPPLRPEAALRDQCPTGRKEGKERVQAGEAIRREGKYVESPVRTIKAEESTSCTELYAEPLGQLSSQREGKTRDRQRTLVKEGMNSSSNVPATAEADRTGGWSKRQEEEVLLTETRAGMKKFMVRRQAAVTCRKPSTTGNFDTFSGDPTSSHLTCSVIKGAGSHQKDPDNRQSIMTLACEVVSPQEAWDGKVRKCRESANRNNLTEEKDNSSSAVNPGTRREIFFNGDDAKIDRNESKKNYEAYEKEEERAASEETLSHRWMRGVCRRSDDIAKKSLDNVPQLEINSFNVPKKNNAVDSVSLSTRFAIAAKGEVDAEWSAAEAVAAPDSAGAPGRLQRAECETSATAACRTIPYLTAVTGTFVGEAGGIRDRSFLREKADRRIALALSGKAPASLCKMDVPSRLRGYMLEPFCFGDTNSLSGVAPVGCGGKKWSSSMHGAWPACASVGVTNEEATGLWMILTSGLQYSRYCDDSGSTSCPSTDDDRESTDEVCSIPRLLFSSGEVMAYSKAVLDASA